MYSASDSDCSWVVSFPQLSGCTDCYTNKMGRKGMKGFLKSGQKAANDGSDDDTEVAVAVSSKAAAGEQAHLQAPAVASTSARDAGSGSDSDEDSNGPETRGKMLQRHKRELIAHKKAVQKMGKKSKDDNAKLAKEIEDRHAKELLDLEARDKASQLVAAEAANTGAEQLAEQMQAAVLDSKLAQKPSKAQKRREKLALEEAEREARIAEEKAGLGPSQGAVEEEALQALLQPLGLGLREIRADGHCLYRSIEDQLCQRTTEGVSSSGSGSVPDVSALRSMAASYIRSHADEFTPFIYDDELPGSPAEQVAEYCSTLESSAEWGGQLELGALAQVLQQQIKVYAVGMPPVTLGDEHAAAGTLTLCYMRHAFGLGEHYNSVQPQRAQQEPEAAS